MIIISAHSYQPLGTDCHQLTFLLFLPSYLSAFCLSLQRKCSSLVLWPVGSFGRLVLWLDTGGYRTTQSQAHSTSVYSDDRFLRQILWQTHTHTHNCQWQLSTWEQAAYLDQYLILYNLHCAKFHFELLSTTLVDRQFAQTLASSTKNLLLAHNFCVCLRPLSSKPLLVPLLVRQSTAPTQGYPTQGAVIALAQPIRTMLLWSPLDIQCAVLHPNTTH